MKEITFNNNQYKIPENWDEVTLGMVIKVSEYDELIEDAPIISIICGYTGIKDNELKLCKMPDMKPILDALDFIYTPYEPQARMMFDFNGQTFRANDSLEEIEFQDWVSTQTLLYQFKDNPVLALPKLIAVICKKDGESLDDFKIEDRAKMFLELPITIAKDVECFFLASRNASNACTLLYSTMPEQEQLVLYKFNELNAIMKQRSRERGWYSPTRWLIGLYRLYLKSLKNHLEKSFNSQHTELSKKNWILTYKRLVTEKFNIKNKSQAL